MNDQLKLSKEELRGLLIIAGLIIMSVLLSLSRKMYVSHEPKITAIVVNPNDIKQNDNTNNTADTVDKHFIIRQNHAINFIEFDPNTLSKSEAQQLGISEKAYSNLKKYLDKGGHIKDAEGFKKIYGIPESLFIKLQPYIKINEIKKQTSAVKEYKDATQLLESKTKESPTTHTLITLEINTASSDEFKQLKGITPLLAKLFATYRNRLGGYLSINQIAEIYNMPDSTYQLIKNQLTCNGLVTKIKLNEVTESDLSAHPYISFKDAKSLIRYRDQHIQFSSLEEIYSIFSIDRKRAEKFIPYLTL